MILAKENSIFKVFFIVKIFCIIFLVPSIQTEWFSDFINNAIYNPNIDPWSNYIFNSGDPLGFPYGPIMILIFLPFSILFWTIGLFFGLEDYSLGIGFRLTLLFFDFVGFLILSKLLKNKRKKIILFYWLSPLIFYVTYIYGQLDIIPTTILLIAYYYLYINKFKISGYFFGLAIATKLSVGMITPLPIIYLWQNKRLNSGLKPFLNSLITILFLFVLIPILSSGYREMVLATPQKLSLLWFHIPLSSEIKIFLLPLTFFIIIYSMWRIKRSNFTLLSSITGLAFLISTLMMPPSPGWYLWALPFLIIYQIKTDINGKILILVFTILPIFIIFPQNIFSEISFINLTANYNTLLINNLTQNLIYTFFISLGIIIALRLYRETIQNNDYYKLSRQGILIGLTGGPSTGKKLLSNALVGILGKHSSLIIDEKDYSKWNENYKVNEAPDLIKTKSRDLLRLNTDLNLILNKKIHKREIINNAIGSIKNKKYFEKDFIIVNGFHLFLTDTLNKLFTIKVFLNPDNDLNENWFLNDPKKNSDTKNENYLNQIQSYKNLYSQQRNYSDLTFSFSYVNKDILDYKSIKNMPLKMDVYIKDGIYAENLSKALISICGVKLNSEISNIDFSAKLSIEGDIWAEDIKLAATRLVPNLDEIIDSKPDWKSDTYGLMQLIVLMQISHHFKYKITS